MRVSGLAETTGKAKKSVEVRRQRTGFIPDLNRLLAISPKTLKNYLGLGSALGGGTLSAELREEIALLVSNHCGCDDRLSVQYERISAPAATRSDRAPGREASRPDTHAGNTLSFAMNVAKRQGHVDRAEVEKLREIGFSEGEIAEIVAVVAVNLFTNFFKHKAL